MMSRSLLLACFSVASLAACTHTIVRDHVVERQPIVTRETVVEPSTVTRETVVEPPAVTHETIISTPGACTIAGSAYSSGYLSCRSGYEYRCGSDGIWHSTGNAC